MLYALSSNGFLGITLNKLPYDGLRLFVAILQDDINTSNKVVKDKIIKSLMQFAYDDLSLKGQLISKEQFGVIKSTKNFSKDLRSNQKNMDTFLPLIRGYSTK